MAFAVSTVFKAFDKVSPAFKKMTRRARAFGIGAEIAFRKANKGSRLFKNITSGILAANVIRAGFMRVAQGARVATEEFINFDHQITSAAVKFPGIAEQIGKIPIRTLESFKQLQTTARKVGATTKFTAGEAAEGLNFLAMAGFNAAQSMALLPKTTELAIATNIDLARATDIATDTLGAFGFASKDAAKQAANLAMVNDVLTATVISANTDMEQLFETIRFAGPVAKTAGISIQEFAAAAGLMANAGIKGSIAGTTFKNALLRLAAPAEKAKKLMKRLKIEVEDGRGNFRTLADILEDVSRATRKMGTRQRSAALDTLFGKRAVAGISVLLANGSKRLKDYTKRIDEAKKITSEMATEINKSLKNRLLQLRSALIEVGFRIFEAFAGEGPKAIDDLVAKVRKFDVKPIVEGLKEVIKFFKFLGDNIDTVKAALKALITVWAGWKIGAAISGLRKFAKAAKGAAEAAGLLKGAGAVRGVGAVGKGAVPAAAKGAVPAAVAPAGILGGILNTIGGIATAVASLPVAAAAGISSALILQGDEGIKSQKLMRLEMNEAMEKNGEFIVEAIKSGDIKKLKQLEKTQRGFVSAQKVGKDIREKGQIRKPPSEVINLEETRQRKELEQAREFLEMTIRAKKFATAAAERPETESEFYELTKSKKERELLAIVKARQESERAPNVSKEEAAQQRTEFIATINVGNAPEGTTVETEVKGSPEVRTKMTGTQ